MFKLDPVNQRTCDNIENTDAAIGRAVDEPLAFWLREAYVVDLVGGSILEIANSLKASLWV